MKRRREGGVGFIVLHEDRYLRARARELERRIAAELRLKPVFESEAESVYRLKRPSEP